MSPGLAHPARLGYQARMEWPAPKIEGGPYVMGVLNVTPDSFSDGGRWADPQRAAEHALAMLAAGADVIDVGGESTRPGASPVGAAEEIARTAPVIEAIRARTDAAISIDTMKPEVARAAFAAGAAIWNDVTALGFARGSPETAAALGADVILMHMQGDPRTMQKAPHYEDVVADVIAYLRARAAAAVASGIVRARLWADPGIGFGKTDPHNLALIAAGARIKKETGLRLVVGASRKSFIGRLAGAASADDRLAGSLAAALAAARFGADMVRVHDVAETVQALRVQRAIEAAP